jgi:hypothetical protein
VAPGPSPASPGPPPPASVVAAAPSAAAASSAAASSAAAASAPVPPQPARGPARPQAGSLRIRRPCRRPCPWLQTPVRTPPPHANGAGTHEVLATADFVEPKRCICVIFPLTFTTSHFGQTLVQHPSALGALASTTPPRRIAVSPVRRSLPMAALLRAQRLLVGAAAPTAGAFRRPAAALSRRLCQQRWAGRAASSLSLHVEYCEK